jgi:hypothetical protein
MQIQRDAVVFCKALRHTQTTATFLAATAVSCTCVRVQQRQAAAAASGEKANAARSRKSCERRAFATRTTGASNFEQRA